MNTQLKAALYGLGAFLAAWQGAQFDLDYRAILGAVTAAILGASSPGKRATNVAE